MAEMNRFEYFAGLAFQALVSKHNVGAGDEGDVARRAFDLTRSMELETKKHNPDDMAEREAERRSEQFAQRIRSSS